MHVAFLAVAFQLQIAALPAPAAQGVSATHAADSTRDLKAARSAQATFEFVRRSNLPEGFGGMGRCDVQLGRYCWWYDEFPIKLPPEPNSIVRRRLSLIATLDSLGELHPGDDWIAAMRVHYRLDGKDAALTASADSVARTCRATTWWCMALVGYANHLLGQSAAAESAFTGALQTMPDDERCKWQDISTLLPANTRHYYEGLSCEARHAVEDRYWILGRPRFSSGGNEWRSEFYVRKLQARLANQSATPQAGTWGRDAEELLLRYGWPVGWSKVERMTYVVPEQSVIGHDPSPSFNFAPDEALYDTSASAQNDAWDMKVRTAESRFAPLKVRRVAPMAMQIARFRRGDSTLVVSAFKASDDSLFAAGPAVLGVTLPDGSIRTVEGTGTSGTAMLTVGRSPLLAGVDVTDTTTSTLARARTLLRPLATGTGLTVSDLLLFHAEDGAPESVGAALEKAIAGDTLYRERPIGVYWETYGVAAQGEALDVAVTVERIDRSWLRGVRQKLKLSDPDSPLRLHWSDARPTESGEALSRAISLRLGNLEPGKYRITMALGHGDEVAATASREVELR
ncbi:MAG TPA: hypothetical protein VF461_18195 [Gemmatimonadaceae bacterium]